jgi:hypothetical protein
MELTTRQAPVEVRSPFHPSGVNRSEGLMEAFDVKVNPGFEDYILAPCTALLAPGITTLRCQATSDEYVSVLRVLQDAGYDDGMPPQLLESVVYDHVLQIAVMKSVTQKHTWLFRNNYGALVMASLYPHPSMGGAHASAFVVDDATRILCPRLAPVYMA